MRPALKFRSLRLEPLVCVASPCFEPTKSLVAWAAPGGVGLYNRTLKEPNDDVYGRDNRTLKEPNDDVSAQEWSWHTLTGTNSNIFQKGRFFSSCATRIYDYLVNF